MPNTFCISTSTSPYPLTVATIPLEDENGAPYYATSTCPALVERVIQQVDNPAQNLYNGIILFLVVFIFVVWYFITRFRTT